MNLWRKLLHWLIADGIEISGRPDHIFNWRKRRQAKRLKRLEERQAKRLEEMKNANFEEAVELVMAAEGGYVCDPADPGGETNYGISKRRYPELDIKNLTKTQAKYYYERDYWKLMRLDEMHGQILAQEILDFGVMTGIKTAGFCIQKTYNKLRNKLNGNTIVGILLEDGIMGSKTIAALNELIDDDWEKALLAIYRSFEVNHIFNIKAELLARFLKGWLNRV